jgi:soluble lytic murein transglycosylase-like protein
MSAFATPAQADVLEIGDDGPRWIAGALAVLTPAADAAIPTAQTSSTVPGSALSVVPLAYRETVRALSARYDLSPALIEALVWQESRWQSRAVSHKGARGLAQLMPGTARDLGVDPDDPHANLEGGARYLRAQLDRFDGNLELALAAYNAGPNRVARTGRVPAIRETRQYVAAILARMSAVEGTSL